MIHIWVIHKRQPLTGCMKERKVRGKEGGRFGVKRMMGENEIRGKEGDEEEEEKKGEEGDL